MKRKKITAEEVSRQLLGGLALIIAPLFILGAFLVQLPETILWDIRMHRKNRQDKQSK